MQVDPTTVIFSFHRGTNVYEDANILPALNGWWVALDGCLNPVSLAFAIHLEHQCLSHRIIWTLGELISFHLCPEL